MCTFWFSAKLLAALGGWSKGWFFNNWPFWGRQTPGEGYFPPLNIKHIFWDIYAGEGGGIGTGGGIITWPLAAVLTFPMLRCPATAMRIPLHLCFPPLVHDNYRLNLVYISTWKKVLLYLSSWTWLPNLIVRYH